MLNSPARNPSASPNPASTSGKAAVNVSDTAFSDPRFSDHLDEERFLEVLVGALDLRALQNAVVPILRTRTGLDFGYYDTHQIKDRQERIAAQEECYDSWRTWWAEREKRKSTEGPR